MSTDLSTHTARRGVRSDPAPLQAVRNLIAALVQLAITNAHDTSPPCDPAFDLLFEQLVNRSTAWILGLCRVPSYDLLATLAPIEVAVRRRRSAPSRMSSHPI